MSILPQFGEHRAGREIHNPKFNPIVPGKKSREKSQSSQGRGSGSTFARIWFCFPESLKNYMSSELKKHYRSLKKFLRYQVMASSCLITKPPAKMGSAVAGSGPHRTFFTEHLSRKDQADNHWDNMGRGLRIRLETDEELSQSP